jgi:hypothetical protein
MGFTRQSKGGFNRAWPFLAAAALGASGCGATDPPTQIDLVPDSGRAYVPDAAWRTATPAAVGMDAERVREIERAIDQGRYGSLHGVVVIRFGHLVLERYRDWSREQPHTMQSVTRV